MTDVEIHIKGCIDAGWSGWFEDLSIHQISSDETVLRGYLADRSAVYGLLSRLSSLGIALISVQCRDEESDQK